MTTYVIRENCFFYGDDYDYLKGSKIVATFEDKAQVEATYKALEIEAAKSIMLCHQESLFCAERDFLKELDDFVLSCCNQHIVIDGRVALELPQNMQDDDIFEFVKRAKIEKYDIFEFEDEAKFLAIWVNISQQWLCFLQETGDYLIYGHCMNDLMTHTYAGGDSWTQDDQAYIEYHGNLEDLTDSPTLVRQILADIQPFWAEYNESQQKLRIRNTIMSWVFSLNSLLKQPIFTIKEISLAEVLEVEQELNRQRQQEYDEWLKDYQQRQNS